ncbi:MAG: chorismate synthase [Bacillota bacterium]
MIRFLTAGESHGPCLTAIIEGFPAGVPLELDALNHELGRRQQGYGRGGRMAIERDQIQITAGVRFGVTLGSPMALTIDNRDWGNWQERMAIWGPEAGEVMTAPRPGHADLSGGLKYSHNDLRNVLERASARETAARVAIGALCKQLLRQCEVDLVSYVSAIGRAEASDPPSFDIQRLRELTERSPVRCPDPVAEKAMVAAIDVARERGDSLGGVFSVLVSGLVPGLGSHVHWDRRLDGRLAQTLMSIPAIKGVEVGAGFNAATIMGSELHDPIYHDQSRGYFRTTNSAGGLEGGITTGQPLVLRAAMKPIATLRKPLASVDMATHQPVDASRERSDTCAVPAAAVVGEAVVAIELTNAYLEKFGGDTLDELLSSLNRYREQLAQR